MADYIKRSNAINALKGLPTWWADQGGIYGNAQPPMEAMLDPEDAVSAIENIPSEDVAEVRHGKWIKPTSEPYTMLAKCSVCGFDLGFITNFCPHCGARMDGE